MPTNLFQLLSACRIRAPFLRVSLATLLASYCLFVHFGEQVHIPDPLGHYVPPSAWAAPPGA